MTGGPDERRGVDDVDGHAADENPRDEPAVDGGATIAADALGDGERAMGADTAAATAVTTERSTRDRLELFGVVLVGILATGMLAFIALDWLRDAPGTVGTMAASWFAGFLVVGEWADFYLGTNVFRHPFVWRAAATGVLVGVVGPVVGSFLVHRQMALIGETLAHTAFAGVAFGMLFIALGAGLAGGAVAAFGSSGTLLIVALIVSATSALGLQWLTERTDSYGDVPIAIVLTGSFAVGTLIISWSREFVAIAIDIEDFLFGSLAIVTATGARLVAVLSVVVVALVVYNYKQFLFITFDERAARVARLRVDRYNALLIVMTATVVVGAMQILGVILVAGLLVIPVAAASQLSQSFRETIYVSVLIGQIAVLGGLAVAIGASLPPGGSIIVIAIGAYLVAVLLSDRSTSLAMH
ncbi:MAG: metal ABC transporter permease [Halorubrum sp.]